MPGPDLTALSILVLEDETLLRKQLTTQLEQAGADVTSTDQVARARQWIADLSFDFALLDVNLPDGLGTDLLKEKIFPSNTGVIVMTSAGGVTGAVEAIRLGAIDYLVKPFNPAELPLVISRAQRSRQAARIEEHRRSDETLSAKSFFFGNALAPLEKDLQKMIAADARLTRQLPPVLIEGETGTGKTTIARLLHHNGPRARQPLVDMNCSALPETLAESELFGHEKGAFTDARSARIGLFEAAHGGTLFLDELPSLSLPLQAKVLKVVEDHRIRRLGGNKEIPVDVRIVAATHQDLKQRVHEGTFRQDLYHRLDLYRLRIPPLRERGPDIPLLAKRLMEEICRRHRLPKRRISADGTQRLLAYHWPGNVRELAHELERAIVFEENDELHFHHLLPAENNPNSGPPPNDWFNASYRFPPQGFQIEDALKRLIQHALNQTNHNASAAARLLGVSRDYIRYHLADRSSPPRD